MNQVTRRVNGITHRALSGVLGTPFLPALAFPSEDRDRWRAAPEHCAAAPAPRADNTRVTSARIHRAAPSRPSRTAHTLLFFPILRSHPKFRFYSAAKRHERGQTSSPCPSLAFLYTALRSPKVNAGSQALRLSLAQPLARSHMHDETQRNPDHKPVTPGSHPRRLVLPAQMGIQCSQCSLNYCTQRIDGAAGDSLM